MLSRNTFLYNRYRIIRPLGKGGFGQVYEALDDKLDCIVAIKERLAKSDSEKMRRAFMREAKLLANLRHPVLPKVTDHFFAGESQYLVMEFIEGDDLATLLYKRQHPFFVEQVLTWADEILKALIYLHTRPQVILHRDIKPANIKLTHEGDIFLLDFGLAKGYAGEMAVPEETSQRSSSIQGFTAAYAPLEQLTKAGTNEQSDIYSLGATLYHLLTGRVPATAAHRYKTQELGQPDPLIAAHEAYQAVPEPVSLVLSQAMAMSRRNRLRSAQEMREVLLDTRRAIAEAATEQRSNVAGRGSKKQGDASSVSPFPTMPSPTQASPLMDPTLAADQRMHLFNVQPGNMMDQLPSQDDASAQASQPMQEIPWASYVDSQTGESSWASTVVDSELHEDEASTTKLDEERLKQAHSQAGAEGKAHEEKAQAQRIASLHTEAESAMANGNWAIAIKGLQEILALDPSHAEAKSKLNEAQTEQQLSNLYAAGRRYYEAGRWRESLDELLRVEEIRSSYMDVAALIAELKKRLHIAELYQAAETAAAREDWSAAIENLRQILVLDQAQTHAARKLQEAEKQHDRLTLYLRGRELYEKGLWSEALNYLGKVQEEGDYKDTDSLITHARYQITMLEAARIDREKQKLEAKLHLEKQAEAQRLYKEALVQIEGKDMVAAVESLKAAQGLDPANAVIISRLRETEATAGRLARRANRAGRLRGRQMMIAGGAVALIIAVAIFSLLKLKSGNRVSNQSQLSTDKTPAMAAPAGMAYVPGGTFRMGRNDGDPEGNDSPAHDATVSAFYMDIYETTNEDYQKFITAIGHQPPLTWNGGAYPADAARKPVTGVMWDEAKGYCNSVGKRLPTEEEWEFAARGKDERLYPWGKDWNAGLANAGKAADGPLPVGTFKGASPYGVYDMVGNVWEWTASDMKSYSPSTPVDTGDYKNLKVIRGCMYGCEVKKATTTYRKGWPANRWDWPDGVKSNYSNMGFRCVQDAAR
jgi:formylglycine-generating enzyme required for sulfatase activity/serine/threonine protein kinase